jgi:hypothetical protein
MTTTPVIAIVTVMATVIGTGISMVIAIVTGIGTGATMIVVDIGGIRLSFGEHS